MENENNDPVVKRYFEAWKAVMKELGLAQGEVTRGAKTIEWYALLNKNMDNNLSEEEEKENV